MNWSHSSRLAVLSLDALSGDGYWYLQIRGPADTLG